MPRQEVRYDESKRLVPVGPASLGEQIGKILALPRRLRYRLKSETAYHPRAEALPLLYPHRIERTSVGVYPDKKLMFRLKILQRLCRVNISHCLFLNK